METLRNTDALASRTQNLLNGYSSKRKSAQQNSETETKNYEEVFARISQQTSERINRLKSTMSPEQLAKLNIQKKYSQPIIPVNVETKTYTGAADAPEAEVETASAAAVESKLSAYKEKIDNMAAKRNVAEKFKNRDIDAEIDALISKKLTGANGESLSIRSDLPTVIKNYEVKQGDTLAGISKNFYKDAFMFKNISTVNEIKAPYKLSEGQNLRIVFHQVQAGQNETLESIAEKYTQNKISPKTLAKLNDKEEIGAGDTLLIPVQFSAAGETPVQTAEQPEKIQRFHLSKNTSDASLEETKRQIEKYASQIERLNF